MDYQTLSGQVKQYALDFFNASENQYLFYHNLAHTEGVVNAAIQIGNHYQLDDVDFFVVVAAAWFHDMGYFSGGPSGHELRGAETAAVFLASVGVDEATVSKVRYCILATRMPQSPANLLEDIVCDADLFHLGTDEFQERNKLMRQECETHFKACFNKQEWRKSTIRLFQEHHYHTEYCRLLLTPKKEENLQKLLQKQEEDSKKHPDGTDTQIVATDPAPKHKKKKDKDNGGPERPDKGIETMFRVAAANHQRLSDMSDNKSHIMISVNSIIISVIIGLVVRRMDTTPYIIVPTLCLLTGSVTAIIFAVLATRPKIPDGMFSKSQVDAKTVNLLFFGNFYKMDFSDYYEGMKKVMADREFLYGSLIRDVYSQGKVLGNKYKLLRISYTVFMYTLILSIMAFAIAAIFFA